MYIQTPKYDYNRIEKKEVILLGDFNINLLNCDSDKDTSSFLKMMLSNSLFPRIIKPTRITTRSKLS